MKLFLKVILIASINCNIFAAELFENKTGDYFIVNSCNSTDDTVVVSICGSEKTCEYDSKKYSCNKDNGSCEENWAQSVYELGYVKYRNLEFAGFKKCAHVKFSASTSDTSSQKCKNLDGYTEVMNKLEQKCPFKTKDKKTKPEKKDKSKNM